MSGLKKFLDNRPARTFSGPRTDFYKKTNGPNTGRLLEFPDDDGDLVPFYQYGEHKIGESWRDRAVCPRSLDPEEDCQYCEQVKMLYEAEDTKRAQSLRANSRSWLLFVPAGLDVPTILELPYGAFQDLCLNLALRGGKWVGTKMDWGDDDCVASTEVGVEKMFGLHGHDYTFEYHRGVRPSPYTKMGFSQRPGKKVVLSSEVPNLEKVFRVVKKVGTTPAPEATAPLPDLKGMTKAQLVELADSMGVALGKKDSKKVVVEKIEKSTS